MVQITTDSLSYPQAAARYVFRLSPGLFWAVAISGGLAWLVFKRGAGGAVSVEQAHRAAIPVFFLVLVGYFALRAFVFSIGWVVRRMPKLVFAFKAVVVMAALVAAAILIHKGPLGWGAIFLIGLVVAMVITPDAFPSRASQEAADVPENGSGPSLAQQLEDDLYRFNENQRRIAEGDQSRR